MITDLEHRFKYHPPTTDDVAQAHGIVRELCLETARDLVNVTPAGREQSLMVTHLEEAMMWANAAIARGQYANV